MSFQDGSRRLTAMLAATVLIPALMAVADEATSQGANENKAAATTQPAVQEETLPAPTGTTPAAQAPTTQPCQIVVLSSRQMDLTAKIQDVKAVLKPRYDGWEMIVEYAVRTRFDAGAMGMPLELRVNALGSIAALVRDRRWNPLTAVIKLDTQTPLVKKSCFLLGGRTWYCYRGKTSLPYPFFIIGRYEGISLVGTLVGGEPGGVMLDQKKGDLQISDKLGKN